MSDLNLERQFKLNPQDVNAEVIDGEAIIINVATGVYYSLEDIGVYIWELLVSEHSLVQIRNAIVDRFQISAEQASIDLENFVSKLMAEKLIAETEGSETFPSSEVSNSQPDQVYKAPCLHIYRDMGDLLALDPPTPGLTMSPWETDSGSDASNTDQ